MGAVHSPGGGGLCAPVDTAGFLWKTSERIVPDLLSSPISRGSFGQDQKNDARQNRCDKWALPGVLQAERKRREGGLPLDTRELFERYGDAVFRLAWSCTGSRQDAEDVTQTVFLKVLERRPDLEPGKERAWLFRVAVNECRSLWRRLKLRRTEPLEEALAVAAPQEEPVLRQVMELKAGEREILYLIYYEGFSTRETASLLGISQTAVTTRRQRARKKLRERLEEEGRP